MGVRLQIDNRGGRYLHIYSQWFSVDFTVLVGAEMLSFPKYFTVITLKG